MRKRMIPSLVAAFFVVNTHIFADTIPVSGGGDAIQNAINAASAGDILVVAPGTYNSINFNGKAITVVSTNPDDPNIVESTIIDANGVGSAVTFANGEGRDSVLLGFTITGGVGTKPGVSYLGGGIYCRGASPTISQNVITGNHLANDGGGCDGGGVWGGYGGNPLVYKNIIMNNSAHRGGGIYTFARMEVLNNVVCHNTGLSSGGGLYLREEASLVANNLVFGNRGNIGEGGGVYLRGAPNSTVRGNTIVGNSSVRDGANLDIEFSDNVAVCNNIIVNGLNSAGVYLYSATVDFQYNDVWNNEGGNYEGIPDQTGIQGNISADPLLTNPAVDDYHLQAGSPCIDSGDPGFVPEADEMDIDGQDRVMSGRVDMGADEYVGYIKPVADAGPDQYFNEVQLITLDGSGSYFYDACGVRQFQWTQTAGPAVEMSDPCAAVTTFMPPSEDEYRFELVVSDDSNTSEPDDVLIVVGNRAPVADAGPNTTCQVGEQVGLDGTGSYDPDPGDELTYTWTQVQGPNVVLEDANTPTPYFDCNEEGLYAFELVVSDGFDDSEPSVVQVATVTLTINQQNLDVGYDTGDYFHYPDVSGTRVAYAVGFACDFTWECEYKNLETGEVSSFSGKAIQPKIDGDIVVWFELGGDFGSPWYHEPSNAGVGIGNIATGVQRTLREYTMSKSYSHPAISGTKVVWLEHLGLDTTPLGSYEANNWYNTPYNICGADMRGLNNPIYFTIDVNVGKRDPYPFYGYSSDFDDVIDISGNIVVWEGEGDIYGADISDLDNIEVFAICTNPARQYDPAICGNIVVWTDERNDGGDIYAADISDTENIQIFEIIKKEGRQEQPAIDDIVIVDVIVYVDVKDGIHAGDIKACCLTKHYGVLDVELVGSPYGMGPAIEGERIVWQDNYYGKAHGIWLEVAYSIADGPIENLTTGRRYDYIQHAIYQAESGDEIVVPVGIHHENINFKGKSLTVRSAEPNKQAVVAATVMNGGGRKPVVTFSGGEDSSCVLTGFTITDGNEGIFCTGASPTITNCRITGNKDAGIESWYEPGWRKSPTIINCTIADNEGAGVMGRGRKTPTIINCLIAGNKKAGIDGDDNQVVTNCTIVGNLWWGISCYNGTITNCIIRDNSHPQIVDYSSVTTVSYCSVEGGWPGMGNTDADPRFTEPGSWIPDESFDPVPPDGQTYVDPNVVLRWSAGEDAVSHDVYFGTDFSDVNSASTDANEYMGNQYSNNWDTNNYDPNGLQHWTTYYWRVDEVNDSHDDSPWKGAVWTFTTWHWEPNLVGWWRFDEGQGLVAADSSAYGNDGTISGSVSWVEGVADGNALEFTNGRVTIPDANELRPKVQVTVSAWVNYGGPQGESARVVAKGANDYETFSMEIDDDLLVFLIRDDVYYDRYGASGARVIDHNEWVHLVGVCDDTLTLTCYTNGEAEGGRDIPLGLSQNTVGMAIGNAPDVSRPFRGAIDEVRIYNRGFSAEEVQTLYHGGPADVPAIQYTGDFHLLSSSPCIDAGDNTAVPADTYDLDDDGNTTEPIPWDLDGNPRIVDRDNDGNSVVDMGAYEFFVPPIEADVWIFPCVINRCSRMPKIMAWVRLPEGITKDQIDSNEPLLLYPGGIEAMRQYVIQWCKWGAERASILAFFDKGELMDAVRDNGRVELQVVGKLQSGRQFCGTDTIRIIGPGLKCLGVFTSHWLEEGCGEPDWCGGVDLNQDSVVNFLDFADVESCCIN